MTDESPVSVGFRGEGVNVQIVRRLAASIGSVAALLLAGGANWRIG
jgi:hypothetical protein